MKQYKNKMQKMNVNMHLCTLCRCIYETLSLEGEKLIPAVGAECCFNQETWRERESNTLKLEDKNLENIHYWGRGGRNIKFNLSSAWLEKNYTSMEMEMEMQKPEAIGIFQQKFKSTYATRSGTSILKLK